MRLISKIFFSPRCVVFFSFVFCGAMVGTVPLEAGTVSQAIPVNSSTKAVETGLLPIALDSDSVYCGGRLLKRGEDYDINVHSGRLTFIKTPACDTIIIRAFRIPHWLTSPSGNPVPEGKRLLGIADEPVPPPSFSSSSVKKITISGNKSFSFNVGRTGDGRFSQGLNLEFDARMADDLRLRGSVSDKSGTGQLPSIGQGGTAILSELDKYFFEIEGRRITARGGDIFAAQSLYLPAKRIKGMYAAYNSRDFNISGDLGRPAGRFITQKIAGIDGRQGPYQAVGSNGAPTGVVPGSETVYLDGVLLEGGADQHYLFDYPSGRLTFSPRVLITSRSRIELDFEAAATDYEQVIYDAGTDLKLFAGKLTFSAGGRRETDDKDKLRFGSLSASDIEVLRQAGDTATLAYVDGAVPDTAGDYTLITDTTGAEYFQYVGGGTGDYSVTFSFVGEGKGDYQYLGDGVYQYVGENNGDYLPVRFLPLPSRNDFFFSFLEMTPYSGGVWRLEYLGNVRNNNLFSTHDDADNFRSQFVGRIRQSGRNFESRFDLRFRQDGYDPVYRIDPPDDTRQRALPDVTPPADELRMDFINVWKTVNNRMEGEIGYLDYRDYLRSYRLKLAGRLLNDKVISPRFEYKSANSKPRADSTGDGLYEKYNAGLALKPIKRVRVDFGFDRELAKNRYGEQPLVDKYELYQGAVFFRQDVLAVSRRIEHRSAHLGFMGPEQDKLEITIDESLGRLQVSMAGTWFNQKELDSDRGDYSERLFITTFRYSPATAWLTFQATYRQNRESVRAFGYRYLRVSSGEGDYRLEDSVYLYDPDGDYIRIREELGDATSVSRGEKNHNLTFYPGRMSILKSYRGFLSQLAFRLRTEISEEMPGKDRRSLSWILPWTSRSGIDYVKRYRRERYTCLLFPAFNFYILNFTYMNSFEEQESGSTIFRDARKYEIEVKNRLSPEVHSYLKWEHKNRDESGSAAIDMNLITKDYSAGLTINPTYLQISPEVNYTVFSDQYSGGEGDGVSFILESIWRQPGRGELRFLTELHSLAEKIPFSQPEYLVTDGKRFGRSALFKLVINYDIGKLWRLTVNLTDNIFEDRPAEFVGRGELIARF
jgi:hypothetical protein